MTDTVPLFWQHKLVHLCLIYLSLHLWEYCTLDLSRFYYNELPGCAQSFFPDDFEKVGIGDDVYQVMLKYVLGIAEEVNKFDVMQFRIFIKDVDTDYLDGCITSAEEFV